MCAFSVYTDGSQTKQGKKPSAVKNMQGKDGCCQVTKI